MGDSLNDFIPHQDYHTYEILLDQRPLCVRTCCAGVYPVGAESRDSRGGVRIEQIGDCTLYLGNCENLFSIIGAVDHVITDPPFDEKTHSGADKKFSNINFKPLLSPRDLSVTLLSRTRRWVIAFCAFEQLSAYRDGAGDCWVRSGIWDKVSNMPQMTGDRPAQGGEALAIMHNIGRKKWNGKGRAAIWRHLVERGEKEHPTQKPLSLMKELIEQFTDFGESILDPFMGGGSTGVACVKTGRKFIGCEIDADYFEIACKRIREAYAQPDMFIEPVKQMTQEPLL